MFPLCSRPTQAGRRTPHPRVTASVEGKGLVHGGGKGGTDGNGGGERGKQRRHFQMYAGGGGPSPPPPAPPSAPLAPSPIVFTQPTATGWVGPTPLTSPHPPPPRPLLISLSPLRPVRLPPLPRPARADGVVATFFSGTEVCLARPPAHPPPLPARPPVRASLPRHRDVGPGREAPSGWRRPRLPQSLPSPSLSAVCLCVSKYVRRRPRCTPARVIVPRTRQPVCQ